MARVVSQSVVDAHLRHDPGVLDCCYRVAEAVANKAREFAPSAPGSDRMKYGLSGPAGKLRAGIDAQRTSYGARMRSHADHSTFNEFGTDSEGPVRAKSGKLMVFYPRGKSGPKIVTLTHKGMKANHFASKAAIAVAASSDRLTWRPVIGVKLSGH